MVGKATCEELCVSGGSWVTAEGPVRNPWSAERSAGGSSSGPAVLVATGQADLALAGDQVLSVWSCNILSYRRREWDRLATSSPQKMFQTL